jgi:hypothetical protein
MPQEKFEIGPAAGDVIKRQWAKVTPLRFLRLMLFSNSHYAGEA